MLIDCDSTIFPADNIIKSVFLLGHQPGVTIFETILLEDGIPLFLQDHVKRLSKGMHFLVPNMDLSMLANIPTRIANLVASTSAKQKYHRLNIFFLVNQEHFRSTILNGNQIALTLQSLSVLQTHYRLLCSSVSTGYSTHLPPYVKLSANPISFLSKKEACQHGFDEALLFNDEGKIIEGSYSNIFFIQDDIVYTPCLSTGCLDGVTREEVRSICEDNAIELREQPIMIDSMSDFSEVFLTSSIREVAPVSTIAYYNEKNLSIIKFKCSIITDRIKKYYQTRKDYFKKHYRIN